MLAERVGFEPTSRLLVNTLSKRAPSATRTPLLGFAPRVHPGHTLPDHDSDSRQPTQYSIRRAERPVPSDLGVRDIKVGIGILLEFLNPSLRTRRKAMDGPRREGEKLSRCGEALECVQLAAAFSGGSSLPAGALAVPAKPPSSAGRRWNKPTASLLSH